MLRFISLLFIICFSLTAFAQDRTLVSGKIIVPENDDPEGMTVYNKTSRTGTITNTEGEFKIRVAVNDSVSFSALQFQRFTVVVDQGVVESGELNVFIRESVEELPEVVLSPHDLSGNVNADVARIRISEVDLPNYSAAELEAMGVRVEPDSLTGPRRNEAMLSSQTYLVNGLNFVNIFKAIVGDNTKRKEIPKREMDDYMRQIYNSEFFRENLNIEEDNINDFIFYASDNGLDAEMMENGNELDLIEFLIAQSRDYKELREEN